MPFESLKILDNQIAGVTNATIAPINEDDLITDVWVPQGGCPSAPSFTNVTSTAGVSVTGPESVMLRDMNGNYTQPYLRFSVKGATLLAGNEMAIADAIQKTKAVFANSCNGMMYADGREVMRNKDYLTNSGQLAYLNYVYSLADQNQSQATIANNIAPAGLKGPPGVAPFSASPIVSYQNPWCAGVKTDLYYGAAPTSNDGGYIRMQAIINAVTGTLGTGKLFPVANSTNITQSAISGNLTAIKMANGTAWYRLFNVQNKCYNVYIAPAENMVGSPSDYKIVNGTSIEPILGPDSIYRFSVLMEKKITWPTTPVTITTHTVVC